MSELLSRLAITRRGWYFPHVNRSKDELIGNDWVGQDTDWNSFRELWRVTKSGQFLHLAGIRYDWGEDRRLSPFVDVPANQSIVGIGDSLHRLSEILEFAHRWAQAVAPDSGVEVAVTIHGILNRRLVIDHTSRGSTSQAYIARVDEPWTVREEVVVGTSIDELWARARVAAVSLFQRFGFQASTEVLEDWQQKIGR